MYDLDRVRNRIFAPIGNENYVSFKIAIRRRQLAFKIKRNLLTDSLKPLYFYCHLIAGCTYISFYRNLILTLNEKGIFVNSSLFHLNIQTRNGKAYDWRCIIIHLVYYINFFFHVLYPSLFHDMSYYSKHCSIFKQIQKVFPNLFLNKFLTFFITFCAILDKSK